MSNPYILNFDQNTTVDFPPNLDKNPITSIVISEGFKYIPHKVFSGFSNLVHISLPNSTLLIEDKAFYQIPIRNLLLPKNVMNISELNPFDNLQFLESIEVNPENRYFCSVEGVLYSKDMSVLIHYPANKMNVNFTIPNQVKYAGKCTFSILLNLK